jgi:hypothetical protein
MPIRPFIDKLFPMAILAALPLLIIGAVAIFSNPDIANYAGIVFIAL